MAELPLTPPLDAASYRDEFGLPRFTLLTESDDQRTARERQVARLVVFAFEAATSHLGEERARILLRRTAARPAVKPKGSTHSKEDQRLLHEYDERFAAGEQVRGISGLVAREAKQGWYKHYPATEKVLADRIRRLLKARQQQQQQQRSEWEIWAAAYKQSFGSDPEPSLVSSAK